jgi:hypothetical protein
MTTFPSTIKFDDINVTTENNVTSNLTSLSGKKEVILGEQHQMALNLKTVPLTELEDRSFQIFINEIRNYGLFDIALSNYTVFKPYSTSSTKMSVSVGSYPVGSKTIFVDESGVNLKVAVGSYIQFENRSSTLLSKLYQVIKIEENIINSQNNNALNTRITLNTGLVEPLVSYLNNNYLFDATSKYLSYTYAPYGDFIYNYQAGDDWFNASYSFVTLQNISAYTNQAYRITAINDSDLVTGTPNIQTATIQGSRSNIRRPGANEKLEIYLNSNAVSGATLSAVSEVQRLYYTPNTRSNTSTSVNTNIGIYSGISSVATQPTAGVYALNINTPEDLTNLTAPGTIAVGKTNNLLTQTSGIIQSPLVGGIEIRSFIRTTSATPQIVLSFYNGNVTGNPFTIDSPAIGKKYRFIYNNTDYLFEYNGSNITQSTGTVGSNYVIIWSINTSAFTTNVSAIPTTSTFVNNQILTYDDRAVLNYNTYNPSTRYFSLANAITTDQAANWVVGTDVRILLYDGNFNSSTASATMISDLVTQVNNNSAITVTNNSTDGYLEFTTDSPGPINGNLHAFVNNNGETNTFSPTLSLNINSNYTALSLTNNVLFSHISLNSTTTYNLNDLTFIQIPQSDFNSSGLNNTSLVLFVDSLLNPQTFSSLSDTTNIYRDTGGLGIYLFQATTTGTLQSGYTNTNWIIAFDPNTAGYDAQYATTYKIASTGYYNGWYSGNRTTLSFANLFVADNTSVQKEITKSINLSGFRQKITYDSQASYLIDYERIGVLSTTQQSPQITGGNGGTFRWLYNGTSRLTRAYQSSTVYATYQVGATVSNNASYTFYGYYGPLTFTRQISPYNNVDFLGLATDFANAQGSGRKWYASLSNNYDTSVDPRILNSIEIVSIDSVNQTIYTNGQFSDAQTNNFTGINSLYIYTVPSSLGILNADGSLIDATVIAHGRASQPGTSFSFDPDLSNLVYTNAIGNQSISASSNADSILAQIGNAIDGLSPNITWDTVISNGDVVQDTNITINGINYVTVSRSTSSNIVQLRKSTNFNIDFTEAELRSLLNILTVGTQLKITDNSSVVQTVTINGPIYINLTYSPITYQVYIPISTSITQGNGIQAQYIQNATKKISIDLGTDTNISPSFSINNINGTQLTYRILSTDGVLGTGTSTTYTLVDPQGNITTSFLSSSTPIVITTVSDAQLNLSTNYTLGYTSGSTFTLTASTVTLANSLFSKLTNGGVYYIGGTSSSTVPPTSNRILTATVTSSLVITCTTYGAPVGITNNTTGNFIFYESTYSSDYQNVLNRLANAISSATQNPIDYYGTANSVARTLTATSSQPNSSSLPWFISVNNNGVTGNDAGDIRFNFGDTLNTYSLFTITQAGQRIVTPSPRQVTFNNVYQLPTIYGFTMGEANSANQLTVASVNTQTNTVSFDLNSSITPTSASWAVGDNIYYSRGFNPLNYYVRFIDGSKIYLDSTAGLDIGSYITAGLNSASTVNSNYVYRLKNVNVEFNYIELNRAVVPSIITSIINSSTSSIRKVNSGTPTNSGDGYIIKAVNSGTRTLTLSILNDISVGTELTSDNSTNNYGNIDIATVTAVNDDYSIVVDTIPASYTVNAELYINNTTYTGYRISSINGNVVTLNRVTGLVAGDRLSVSNDDQATPHLEILSIGAYPLNTITLNATPQQIDDAFFLPNLRIYRSYSPVESNIIVTGANYLTNQLNLNSVNGLRVNNAILGAPLKTVTINSVGNDLLTPFNGTYTEEFNFDNTFMYNSTSWDPENNQFGIVAGSTIYKKDNDEIYIWNRKDTSTSQGGWHITYPNTSYPWLYLSTGNPQSSSLTSTGTWRYVQAGVTANQLNVNNSANVIFTLYTGTVDGNPTTITTINTATKTITVTEADQISVGSTIRVGTSVQSKCKVRHKDLMGKFRMDNGEFNSSSSYLLADGTQMKVYRFKLNEEL